MGVIKKLIKKVLSFLKDTVSFGSFLVHLLAQTKGNLHNPIKKIYSGKVVMLANGPSMKDVLPRLTTEEFRSMDFIVLNFMGMEEVFVQIRPKHYCLADPMFFQKNHNYEKVMKLFNELNEKVNWEMNLYIPRIKLESFVSYSNLKNKHIRILPLNLIPYSGYEVLKNFFYRYGLSMPPVATVANMAIYVGINSGYHEISLYGVDHTFFDSMVVNSQNQLCNRDKHFYDNGEVELKPILRNDNSQIWKISDYVHGIGNMFTSHDLLSRYAKSQNVKIWNCTECSMIDSYDRK